MPIKQIGKVEQKTAKWIQWRWNGGDKKHNLHWALNRKKAMQLPFLNISFILIFQFRKKKLRMFYYWIINIS